MVCQRSRPLTITTISRTADASTGPDRRHTALVAPPIRFPYLDAPVPLAFAHRGGAAVGDENTAEAFGRAIALGYRYVETDVQATRDGVAVVFHDETLDRVAGRPGTVADLTWRDLATVRVGGAAAVPRLDEVLTAWPQVRFNIDVKADAAVEPTVAVIGRGAVESRVLLASFSDTRLARLRRLAGPAVATSLGQRGVARLRLASLTGARTPWPGPAGRRRPWRMRLPGTVVAAQVPPRAFRLPMVDARFVRYAHRLGLQVHVWTIDDAAEIHRLLDLGVDGIMTDHVDVLREVYLARGAWQAG
jgi:glycerophosphoryl diester phosphodiesterase